jgi:hypothetical protein
MTAQWRTAPVNGVWRLENAEYNGHRLTVYRSRAGGYRAYVDGRMIGLWRSKQAAIEAAEKAAFARTVENRLRIETSKGVAPMKPEASHG